MGCNTCVKVTAPPTPMPTPAPPSRSDVAKLTSRCKTQLSLAGFSQAMWARFGATADSPAQLAVRKAAARKARVSYLYVFVTVVRFSTRRLTPGVVIDLEFASTPANAAALMVSIRSLASTVAEQEDFAADIRAELQKELQKSGAAIADGVIITVAARGDITRSDHIEPPAYVGPATVEDDRPSSSTGSGAHLTLCWCLSRLARFVFYTLKL